MDKELLLLITCLLIALGGYVACFYFAKRDAPFYAFAAFIIASTALSAGGKVVYDKPGTVPAQTTTG